MTLQAPPHSPRTPEEGTPQPPVDSLARAGAVHGTLHGLSTGSGRAAPHRVGLRSPEPSPLGRPNPAVARRREPRSWRLRRDAARFSQGARHRPDHVPCPGDAPRHGGNGRFVWV